jgi:hypothetical protein
MPTFAGHVEATESEPLIGLLASDALRI